MVMSVFSQKSRCEDTINDIHIGSDGKFLVAASADGTLCAFNCKRRMFLHER